MQGQSVLRMSAQGEELITNQLITQKYNHVHCMFRSISLPALIFIFQAFIFYNLLYFI